MDSDIYSSSYYVLEKNKANAFKQFNYGIR